MPQLGGELATLRVLVIVFPLLTVSTIELHVRSGRGRNREVLVINVAALVANVLLCLVLLPTVGLVGGALRALAVSEFVQTALLLRSASATERALVGPALAIAIIGAITLAITGIAMEAGLLGVTLLGVALSVVVVVFRMPWIRIGACGGQMTGVAVIVLTWNDGAYLRVAWPHVGD